jgi:uncharacterized protein (DUF427 family)
MSDDTRGRVRVEPGLKRVRAFLGGAPVFDTVRPLYVWEHPSYPAYYIPRADVLADLEPVDRREHSPSRGDAAFFDVVVDGRRAPAAAWAYPESPLAPLRDAVRFEWAALDEWLEEDEPVYGHPRSPYTRVDILPSSRRIQVAIDGIEVADSDQPRILFETGLPARYYLPLSHVRSELLRPSATRSLCPYKGWASYFSLEVAGHLYEDYVWIYRTPLPESIRISGLVAFYNEKVDITVDGELQERPRTVFS